MAQSLRIIRSYVIVPCTPCTRTQLLQGVRGFLELLIVHLLKCFQEVQVRGMWVYRVAVEECVPQLQPQSAASLYDLWLRMSVCTEVGEG